MTCRLDDGHPVPLDFLEVFDSETGFAYLRGLVESSQPVPLELRLAALVALASQRRAAVLPFALDLLEKYGAWMDHHQLWPTLYAIESALSLAKHRDPERWAPERLAAEARVRAYAASAPEHQRSFLESSLERIAAGGSLRDPRFRGGR